MPTRPPRAYAQAPKPRAPDRRPSAHQRGYSVQWQKARAGFLAKHPRCECPDHKGRADAPLATVVDHIEPHKGDKVKFWTRSNWQAMATRCHNAKTNRYDGGFGHKVRPHPLIGHHDARTAPKLSR